MNEQWRKCKWFISLFNWSETCCIYPVVSSFWYTVLCGEQEGKNRKCRYILNLLFSSQMQTKSQMIVTVLLQGRKASKGWAVLSSRVAWERLHIYSHKQKVYLDVIVFLRFIILQYICNFFSLPNVDITGYWLWSLHGNFLYLNKKWKFCSSVSSVCHIEIIYIQILL